MTIPGTPDSRPNSAGTAIPLRKFSLVAGMLFLMSLVAYASFLQTPSNPNVSSRMFLAMSLVGQGELSIDPYAQYTIDKSQFRGRFYSDKAPGLSLLAVPVTSLAWHRIAGTNAVIQVDGRVGDGIDHPLQPKGWTPSSPYYQLAYLATVSTSGLIAAASVAALFLVTLSLFGNPIAAVIVALAYGFATPVFGWATAFFGHAPAAGLLCIGFACLHFVGRDGQPARRDDLLVFSAIACLTWAVATEFTAAPAAAMTIYAGKRILDNRGRRVALVGWALAAVIAFSIPLLAYNYLAFGSPWHVGYGSVQGFPGMKQGLFGISVPQVEVLYEITFGQRRGIFQLCPLLLLFPAGLLAMARQEGQRGTALLVSCIVAYYLLLNASYFYWDGGASTGPRHITGAIPFACLPLAAVWISSSRSMKGFMLFLLSASLVLALLCVSVGMFARSGESWLLEYLIHGLLGHESTALPVHLLGWRSRYFLLGFVVFAICSVLAVFHQVCRIMERSNATGGLPAGD